MRALIDEIVKIISDGYGPVEKIIFAYAPEEFERMRENENPFIMSALKSAKITYLRDEN